MNVAVPLAHPLCGPRACLPAQPLDYNLAREVKDLERFAVSNMPNFVELVEGSRALSNFMAKADEWGLPKVSTSSIHASNHAIPRTARRAVPHTDHALHG